MKLLFQADDYGLTESTACGILKGIREGVIRNTGLFVNMPASEHAASMIRDVQGVCVGIDFNLVAGCPISNVKEVPSLVDENGVFIASRERMKSMKGMKSHVEAEFDQDPYPYEETYLEIENQYKKYLELMGRKPGYLHGHSLITPNIMKAIREVGKKYDVPVSFDLWQACGLYSLPCDWTPKPFPLEAQLKTNVEENLMRVLPQALDHELNAFICHAGFVEEELFHHSSYTMIRAKDLAAATSKQVKDFVAEHEIELITYDDLMKRA